MSPFTFPILLLIAGAIWWLLHNRHHKLPPGPQPLPIIGNLHMLGSLPHRSLMKLSKKYGPIMSFRLGSVQAIIVSSPQAAELFLKTHDAIFASRPRIQASEILSYGSKGIAFGTYGPYWRNMRKFCTSELLCPGKIESLVGMRREEMGLLVEEIKKAVVAREVVDLSEKVAGLIEDMTYRMVIGRSKDERFDLKSAVHEASLTAGAINFADYLPFVAPFDLQGLGN